MKSVWSSVVVVVVVAGTGVGAGGCAERAHEIVGSEPTVLWSDNNASPEPPKKAAPMSVDEARSIALAHDAAHNCEITARMLRAKDKQRGWAVMRECVLRPDYTDLESLVSQPWLGDLVREPDYANLVAHVIAVRGGDVTSDLRVCRRARLPMFSLKAALAEPDAYAGKLVLMRGAPSGGRTVAGSRAIDIAETKIVAESGYVNVGPQLETGTQSETFDRTNNGRRGQLEERTQRRDQNRVEVLHNVSVETGLEVLAQVEGDAPFLESGNDYVLVLRFDGTRESVDRSADGGGSGDRAVATVVGYFEPESGLFARLGR